MFTQKNVLHSLIIDDVASSASAGDIIAQASDLSDGEGVLVDNENRVLNTTTVNQVDKVRVAVRHGSEVFFSPFIEGSKITAYKGQVSAADQEQISYLGYNGSSGAMDDTANETYIVRIIRRDTQATFNSKEELKFGVYKSASTTTQADIATGLVGNLIKNFKKHRLQGEQEIKFELVNNDPAANTDLAALGTPTGDLSVTLGSTKVTVATDTASLSAGDYLRFSGSATEGLTDASYKIESVVSSTEIRLAVPYQGATDAAYSASNVHLVPKAEADVADFGIRFTGVARKFEVGKFKYSKVYFEVLPDDSFVTATVTDSQSADQGVGTWEHVAELEYFTQGNLGLIERVGVPAPTLISNVTEDNFYSLLSIDFYDEKSKSFSVQNRTPKKLVLAINTTTPTAAGGSPGGCIDDVAVGVVTLLDDLVVAEGTGTAQIGNI